MGQLRNPGGVSIPARLEAPSGGDNSAGINVFPTRDGPVNGGRDPGGSGGGSSDEGHK